MYPSTDEQNEVMSPSLAPCYGAWVDVKERLPDKGLYVILLADRYWNVPDGIGDMKVTATGYLVELGHLYWSVFGEGACSIDAFMHWMPIPDAS